MKPDRSCANKSGQIHLLTTRHESEPCTEPSAWASGRNLRCVPHQAEGPVSVRFSPGAARARVVDLSLSNTEYSSPENTGSTQPESERYPPM